MAPLLAALLPLVPSLIKGVERIITAPKSGQDRKDVVRQQLRVVAEKMLARKEAEGSVTDDQLDGAIEAIFQQVKVSGELEADRVAASSSLYLVQVGSGGFIRPLGIQRV
jgi:hypothetical protein